MRRTRSFLAAALSLVALGWSTLASAGPTGQRAIDPSKSMANFSIAHVFVGRVTGTVPVLRGSVGLNAGSWMPVNASAVLDATKLNTGDRDRDGSLEGPDYFDATKYGTWTFSSTKVTPTGPAACRIDGMLTIHGVTQPEHLDVTISGSVSYPTYRATAHIDRHAFGMKGARLDPVIGDEADVALQISLK